MTANIGSPENRVSAVTPPQKTLKRMQGSSELLLPLSTSFVRYLSTRNCLLDSIPSLGYREMITKNIGTNDYFADPYSK